MSAGYFLSGLLPNRLFPTNYWPGYGVIGGVGVRITNEILYPGGFSGTPTVAKTDFLSPGMGMANGSTVVYEGDLIDYTGGAVPPSLLSGLTLSLVDTASGAAVNGVGNPPASILNTGRGTLDQSGRLTITLSPQDMVATDATEYRSMVIDFTYPNAAVGRHQVNFFIVGLAGA